MNDFNHYLSGPTGKIISGFIEELMGGIETPARRTTFTSTASGNWQPSADTLQTNDQYIVQVEVPGLSITDLRVYVEGNKLMVSGNRTVKVDENIRSISAERPVGSFERSFAMPTDIDTTNIKSKLNAGVLTITMPKSVANATKVQQIAIEGIKE